MPKVVDHDERRRQIAEAVLDLVATGGVQAATLRRIAAESGIPMSTIQHYFRTTHAMLRFALEMKETRKAERIAARVHAEWHRGPRAVLEGIMAEVLPLSPAQRRDTAIGTAFYEAWHRDADLKAMLLQDIPAAKEGFAVVVREGQRLGQIDTRRDPDREADLLFTLTDALASGIIIGYHNAEQAQQTAGYYLDRLFTP